MRHMIIPPTSAAAPRAAYSQTTPRTPSKNATPTKSRTSAPPARSNNSYRAAVAAPVLTGVQGSSATAGSPNTV